MTRITIQNTTFLTHFPSNYLPFISVNIYLYLENNSYNQNIHTKESKDVKEDVSYKGLSIWKFFKKMIKVSQKG